MMLCRRLCRLPPLDRPNPIRRSSAGADDRLRCAAVSPRPIASATHERGYSQLVTASRDERHPAVALVGALVGRTVIEATCDGEGVDDVRLLLDDGTAVLIDAELNRDSESLVLADQLGRAPWPRLRVLVGGRELWPFDQD